MDSSNNTLPQTTATRRKKEPVDKTLHDTDFFEDSKIQEIEATFGDAAPAYYLRVAFRILKEGGPIRFNAAIAILSKTKLGERANEFLSLCVEIGLFYRTEGLISSARADREIEALAGKRDKWREKKRIPKTPQQLPSTLPGDSPGNPTGIPGDSEKEEEGEEEKDQDPEIVPIGIPPEPDLPDELADFASQHLETLETATLRDFNIAAQHGRRPMKQYPQLWFRPDELMEIVSRYGAQGIPPDQLHLGFRFVADWMRGEIDNGRDARTLANKSAAYVNGMGLREAKAQYAGFLDVQRKQSYQVKK